MSVAATAPRPIRVSALALAPTGVGAPVSLVDALLREQQILTAAERFAERHERGAIPAPARRYRDLLPASPPGPGQQYAFDVDLDACTGCKACVAACHNLNGLDQDELWRTVGLLHGGGAGPAVQRSVTTSCHHCVDPGCLAGCPVGAYEKDPKTGVVAHLDDQCIGCQYCTLMCPYDAPKYNAARGIVRKCDMCSGRLAHGEAPACVQACPNGAIRIQIIDQASAIKQARTGTLLPEAPSPDHTVPTTTYRSRPAPTPTLLPADHYRSGPEHAHWPLVVMLTLTQFAVGSFVVNLIAARLGDGTRHPFLHAVFGLAVAGLALGASLFHLGRPRYFFRAIIGWRTSWLSREIAAFSLFAKLALAHTMALLPPALLAGVPGLSWLPRLAPALELAAALAGVAGVAASTMVYAATRRAHWRPRYTGPRFALSTAVTGSAAVFALDVLAAAWRREPILLPAWPPLVLIALAGAKLLFDASFLRHRAARAPTSLRRMAVLMTTELAVATKARFLFGAAGGLLIPLAFALAAPPGAWTLGAGAALAATAALVFLVAGEFAERYLFFAAAPPSRMPGGLS